MARVRTMRGVILDCDLWTAERASGETLHIFLELEEGVLHARRSYGERASILSVDLDDLEGAIAALAYEHGRRNLPVQIEGQTALDVDGSDGDT